MIQLLKCKACGYIIKENELGDICPACGAKRIVFEPLNNKISDKRQKILDMHMHPIMTHFSNGFCVFILLLTCITLLNPNMYRIEILNTILILSLFLPIFVSLTIITGLIDGKVRFKKLNRP
ncbi:MAG: rubredoxin-like domain-containing protein, partial [Promethearchaeota archaeon]